MQVRKAVRCTDANKRWIQLAKAEIGDCRRKIWANWSCMDGTERIWWFLHLIWRRVVNFKSVRPYGWQPMSRRGNYKIIWTQMQIDGAASRIGDRNRTDRQVGDKFTDLWFVICNFCQCNSIFRNLLSCFKDPHPVTHKTSQI